LAGEKLEDGAGFTRLSGGNACNHKARNEEHRRDTASPPPSPATHFTVSQTAGLGAKLAAKSGAKMKIKHENGERGTNGGAHASLISFAKNPWH